jgi:predicted negative regulator of RcsB-dependent stress response
LFIVTGVAVLAVLLAAGGWYLQRERAAGEEAAAFAAAERPLLDPRLATGEREKQTQAAFQAFVAAYPDARLTPAAWIYLARFAADAKTYDKAEAAYQKALAQGGIDPILRVVALVGLGKLRESQGKPEQAQAFYDQIGDKNFEHLKAYVSGSAALAAGKPEQARKQFQAAASGQPPSAVTLWARDALDYLP